MKIKKSNKKKVPPAAPSIQRVIKAILEASDSELPAILDSHTTWNLPKCDLYNWQGVLDRFDSILEAFVQTNELSSSKFNHNPGKLTPAAKTLVTSVLKFSRLLFDHGTNRSIYSSYEHLDALLVCTDLDIVEQTLTLMLRPAQRLSMNRSMKTEFNSRISKHKLNVLSANWETKEYGLELVDLGSPSAEIGDEAGNLKFQFYRSAAHIKEMSMTENAKEPPQTPVKGSTEEGLVNIKLSKVANSEKSVKDIYADLVKKYNVTLERHFPLYHAVRIAHSIKNPLIRKQLVVIKLLAIAVYCYIVPEDAVNTSLFLYEPTIIKDLAETLNPDKTVYWEVRTSALNALNSIAHLRLKFGDVLNALNASANHGVLTYLFRKILLSMEANQELDFPTEFSDSLFNFILYIITTNTGGNAVISAGMIQTFIRFLPITNPNYLKIITKCVVLLDNLLYGFTNSLSIYCNADGVSILVNRIKYEVSQAVESTKSLMNAEPTDEEHGSSSQHVDDSRIKPVERVQLIKSALKFVYHMMTSSGSSEGLRSLIDGPLPQIIIDVLSRSRLFGSFIYSQATNILAIFIHNEPTYLAILQEIGLPKVFLDSMRSYIPTLNEAVFAILNALSAVCLNPPGLAQVKEAKPLRLFFKIFIQEPYMRSLMESDVCPNIGSSVDELIRHQPALKDDLFEALFEMLDELSSASNEMLENHGKKTLQFCRLQTLPSANPIPEVALSEEFANVDDNRENSVPYIVSCFVDNISKLLEGFFLHTNHCKDFIDRDGVVKLMKIYNLSTIPYDFAMISSSYSLSHLFRTISETNASCIVPSAITEMLPAFERCREFVEYRGKESLFTRYVNLLDSDSEGVQSANSLYRSLVTVHGLTGLWSDLYCSQTFSASRAVSSIIQGLAKDEGIQILKEMNRLHRACVWEHHCFKRSIPKIWLQSKPKKQSTEESSAEDKLLADPNDPRVQNARHLQFLVAKIPSVLIPLLSGLGKMLYPKRSPELRKHVQSIAKVFSDMLIENLEWRRSDEPGCEVIRHNYYSVLFGQMKILFFDESSGQVQILPYLSYVFIEQCKGIAVLHRVFSSLLLDGQAFVTMGKDGLSTDDQDRRNGYFSALENIMSLFRRFVDTAILNEGKFAEFQDTKVYDFIIPIRSEILDCMIELWNSNVISSDSTPPSITRLALGIISLILEGKDEESPSDSMSLSELVESAEISDDADDANEADQEPSEEKDPSGAGMQVDGKSAKVILRELKDAYKEKKKNFRETIFNRSFSVLDVVPTAIFEISDILALFCKNDPASVINVLFEEINKIHLSKDDIKHSHKLALRFRLLATILINDSVSKPALIQVCQRLKMLSEIVTSEADVKKGTPEQWNEGLTAIFVVLDRILAFLQTPSTSEVNPDLVTRQSERDMIAKVTVVKGEEEAILGDGSKFEPYLVPFAQFSVQVLGYDKSTPTLINAALRTLSVLTRYPVVVSELFKMNAILPIVRASRKSVLDGNFPIQSIVCVIMRHLVELGGQPGVLYRMMEQELIRKFYGRTHPADIKSFLTSHDFLALRDFDTFVKVSSNICEIVETGSAPYMQVQFDRVWLDKFEDSIEKKKLNDSRITNNNNNPSANASNTGMELSPTPSQMELTLEGNVDQQPPSLIVKCLIDEFMSLSKEKGVFPRMNALWEDPKALEKQKEANEKHFYRCFILQLMAELISSYPSFAADVVQYCKQGSGASGKSKYKNGFLGYILNEIIPFGSVSVYPRKFEVILKKKLFESQWAGSLICALCTEDDCQQYSTFGPNPDSGSEESEGDSRRKFVLENMARSMKDAIYSEESVDLKYGRMLAFAELIPKILRSRVQLPINGGFSTRSMGESVSLAKIMIERKFILLLTTMLGEIDLHHPVSKTVVNSILKPLELLSNLSNKLSTAPDAADLKDIVPPVFESEFEDEGDNDDEEDSFEDEEAYLRERLGLPPHGDDEDDEDLMHTEELMMQDEEEMELMRHRHRHGRRRAGDDDMIDAEDDEEDDDMMDDEDGDEMIDDDEEVLEVDNPNDSELESDEDGEDEDESDDEMEIIIRPPHEHGLSDNEDDFMEDDDDDDDDDEIDGDDNHAHDAALTLNPNANIGEGSDDNDDDNDDDEDEDGEDDEDGDADEDQNEGEEEGEGLEVVVEAFDEEDSYDDEEDDDLMYDDMEIYSDNEEGAYVNITATIDGRRRLRRAFGAGAGAVDDSMIGAGTTTHAFDISWRDVNGNTILSLGSGAGNPGIVDTGMPLTSSNSVGPGGPAGFISAHPLLSRALVDDSSRSGNAAAQGNASNSGMIHASTNTSERRNRQVDLHTATNPLQLLESLLMQNTREGAGAGGSGVNWRFPQANSSMNSAATSIQALERNLLSTEPAVNNNNNSNTANSNNSADANASGENSNNNSERTFEEINSMGLDMVKFTRQLAVIPSSRRLIQESHSLFGPKYGPLVLRCAGKFLNALLPKMHAEEEENTKKAEERRKKIEEEMVKKMEEEKKRLEEEAAEASRRAAEEAEAAERRRIEEEERNRQQQIEAEAQSATQQPDANMEVEPTAASEPANIEPAQPAEETAPVAEPSSTSPIEEDPGIDPAFLEALPEDLRREVLVQYFDERYRSVVPGAIPAPLSQAFLDGLGDGIREEVLNQERIARDRFNEERALQSAVRSGTGAANLALEDMDAASFFATLDPELRQQILIEQDESFLATLPTAIIAEANAAREREQRRTLASASGTGAGATRGAGRVSAATGSGSGRNNGIFEPIFRGRATAANGSVHKDAMQVVDRQGILTLTRLIFLPDVLNKRLMLNVLGNICLNSKTCNDLIVTLLIILNEGHVDFNVLEKANTPLSSHKVISKGANNNNNASSSFPKRKSSSVSRLKSLQNTLDHLPMLVSQRCVEVLLHLVTNHPRCISIFLRDCESLKDICPPPQKLSRRKSKGKERANPVNNSSNNAIGSFSTIPFFNLMMLVERTQFLTNPVVLEPMMQLLGAIIEPLSRINEKVMKDPNYLGRIAFKNASGEGENMEVESSTSQKKKITLSDHEEELHLIYKSANLKIPSPSIKSLVNCLVNGNFTGTAFTYALVLIGECSIFPGASVDLTEGLVTCISGDIFKPLTDDLECLHLALERNASDVEIQKITLDRFANESTAHQQKLRHVLMVLDHIFMDTSKRKKKGTTTSPTGSTSAPLSRNESNNSLNEAADESDQDNFYLEFDEKTKAVFEEPGMTAIWNRMSDCLKLVSNKTEMYHVATVLLPLIECFFIVCNHYSSVTNSNKQQLGSSGSNAALSSPIADRKSLSSSALLASGDMAERFHNFSEANRKLLNQMIRNNSDLLGGGSFTLLVKTPKVLDFDNKRSFFRQQLHKKSAKAKEHYGPFNLNVRRSFIFEDSYHQVMSRTGNEFKYGKLNIRFRDEEGVDAGGVTREWYSALARQMFNPDYALFKSSAVDKITYQPNRASWVNPDHLSFFKFVGRVIGKAIYDGRVLDCYFTRSFYKHILSIPVDYKDMEAIDPEIYKSLVWILENDITDVLELTFSSEADDFGKRRIVDLMPDGRNIAVTQENKHEYVRLITEMRLHTAIKSQIDAFKDGFFEVVPKRMVSIFNEQELELLISGLPDIDVDDWKNNTEYQGYSSSSPQISWFWRLVRAMSQEERAKLLLFVTGTSKVPLEGFKSLQGSSGVQRFQIHKAFGPTDRLPSAHTCFNQLDLPMYDSYEKLRELLLLAVNECAGFGFS